MSKKYFIGQLQNKYAGVLKNLIVGAEFEPIVLWGGKNKPASTVQLHDAVKYFIQYEKKDGKKGWNIHWEEWTSKKLGKQKWPEKIIVDTLEDYLFLVDKSDEAACIRKKTAELAQWKPSIIPWLAERPECIFKYMNAWGGICAVVDYFLEHDVSGQYLRSLPVPVHTKFIETHEGLLTSILAFLNQEKYQNLCFRLEHLAQLKTKPVLFTLRWLDMASGAANGFSMEVLGLPPETLRLMNWQLAEVWLVENETALYMLPARKNALAIWTKGKAVELLKDIPFFKYCNLFYWGDMDEDGYFILSQCRKLYPAVKSVLMNSETLTRCREIITSQPAIYRIKNFSNLTDDENYAFEALRDRNGRVEQEQISQKYIFDTICVID